MSRAKNKKLKYVYTDLPKSYLCKEPPPLYPEEIQGSVLPLSVAVRGLSHYEAYDKPIGWIRYSMVRRDRIKLCELFRDEDISFKGVDWPDWREYAILTMVAMFRVHIYTHYEWYINVDWDSTRAMIDENYDEIMSSDLSKLMILTRELLNEKNRQKFGTRRFYICLLNLIFIKYRLYLHGEETYELLMPIYISLYMKFLNVFRLYHMIVSRNKFWLVHSTLHAYPWELTVVDFETFEDTRDWLYISYGSLTAEVFFSS